MTGPRRAPAGRLCGLGLYTRRTLLLCVVGVAGLAACSSRPNTSARATTRVARVGYVAAGTPGGPNSTTFLQGLSDRGWVEGQNLVVHYRWGSAGTEDE